MVVDRLNKFSHLFFVTSSFSFAQVADLFFNEIFKLHGLPKMIVSDRDGKFMSAFWKKKNQIGGLSVDSKYKIQSPKLWTNREGE